MNPITHLGREDLEALLGQYDLGALVDYRRAVLGIENTNYFVRTRRQGTDAEWVLTVQEQPSYSGGLLVPLLRRCQDAGPPVAPVVATKDGRAHVGLNGKAVLLTPMLSGAHPDAPTKGPNQGVGQSHRRTARSRRRAAAPGHAPLPPRRCLAAAAGRRRPPALDFRRRPATRCLPAAGAAGTAAGRDGGFALGADHGDLFRDNVLFDGKP